MYNKAKAKTEKLYFSQFKNNFSQYKNIRIYLFHGNDDYQKNEGIKLLRDNFTSDASRDFDTVTFYADNCQITDVIENLEMLPFMGHFKFVLLKNIDSLKKNALSSLQYYCKTPQKSSILVLTADKIDSRTQLIKTIKDKGTIIECKKPFSSNHLLRWLDNQLRFKKIVMDNDARNFLVNNIELNYQCLENELEKLYLYTHGSNRYSLSHVRATLGVYRENTVYDLQRALGNKDLKLSQKILNNILASQDSGNTGVMLVSLLTRYFLLLWKVNMYRAQSFSDRDIAAQYLPEVFYSFREEYLKASRNFDNIQIRKVFSELLSADTALKSININDTTLFMMVYRICTL